MNHYISFTLSSIDKKHFSYTDLAFEEAPINISSSNLTMDLDSLCNLFNKTKLYDSNTDLNVVDFSYDYVYYKKVSQLNPVFIDEMLMHSLSNISNEATIIYNKNTSVISPDCNSLINHMHEFASLRNFFSRYLKNKSKIIRNGFIVIIV